ncbi:MAG: energy-coupling factor transporter transmembrane protein EcfT [Lachnospiraceae bacterium]|nr:energy-coupling factor transporter transmembrane protein EcfT [Lachnospiraceae bacterium]
MMSNITIGQYYHENSILHRLDPRVKLIGTAIFVIVLFAANNIISYSVITLALILTISLSKVPFLRLLKGIRPILVILLISAMCNMLFTKGGEVLFSYGVINITKSGVIKSVYIAVRLIYLVIGTSVMTLTTKPSDIADGLEKIFGFLTKIKIPVHEIAMMMSLALRFIPTLMEESDKIIRAQKARGADFDSGGLIRRIKNYLPILVPLFISAINRAMELANAMDARCYSGGKRTKMKPLKYARRDFYAYGILIAFLITIVIIDVLISRFGSCYVFTFFV